MRSKEFKNVALGPSLFSDFGLGREFRTAEGARALGGKPDHFQAQ
jgi:hypothetical protein